MKSYSQLLHSQLLQSLLEEAEEARGRRDREVQGTTARRQATFELTQAELEAEYQYQRERRTTTED